DPVAHYNKWQAGFAVVVGLIMAFSQFLKYKRTNIRQFFKTILYALLIALLITALTVYVTKVYTNFMYILITFAAVFALVANAKILAEAVRGKWKLAGSFLGQLGFALLMICFLYAVGTIE